MITGKLQHQLPCKPLQDRSTGARTRKAIQQGRVAAQAKSDPELEKPNPGLGLKAVWLGAENFGKIIGLSKGSAKSNASKPLRKMSREEVVASIREDYSKNYFVTGIAEMEAYDPQCLFADPFAGFNGVDRFKQNVSNLGGLMEDIQLDLLDFQERDNEVETKWRFSALLQLPWKPRLAAAGGTTHVFDAETGRVIKHIERWDVEPGKVVKQLLRPARRRPEGKAETFMQALSEGDAKNMWLSASDVALKLSLPIVLVSLITKLITGHGLPGVLLGSLEGLSFLIALAAGSTEIYKTIKK